MYEETKTFELKDKTKEEIQFTFEMILQIDLMFSYETKSVFNQIVINFYDEKIVKELQKDNYIKIAQIGDKFHITIKGKLSQSQSAVLWTKFSRDANVPLEMKEPEPLTEPPKLEIKEEILEVKKEIIADVQESIEEPDVKPLPRKEIIEYLLSSNIQKGFPVKKVEIWNFVENYKKKFNRYLTKNDMESVGIGYIQMFNEKMGMPITEEEIAKEEALPLLLEELKAGGIGKRDAPPKIGEGQQLKTIQKKTVSVSERMGEFKKAKTFEQETLQITAEPTKLQNISLTKKQNGLVTIPKIEGRRKCPNCEESNPKMIHESVDKTVLISHFPRIFGKKYKCGNCGVIWREGI